MRTLLRKVKWNRGEMDGTKYDYTRIYIEIPVYDKQEKEFGLDVMELEFGEEVDHKKLAHLRGQLPVLVDVEWVPAKKGNNNINVVMKLDVVEPPKAKPQPNPN